MIDWFVLLTPLAVLPIVLLFVFVGCGLDVAGKWSPDPIVRLHYGPGFQTGIEWLEVKFRYQLDTDATPQDIGTPTKLTQFEANGGDVDKTAEAKLSQKGDGFLYCECTPTLQGITPSSYSKSQERKVGKDLGVFVISRSNGGFNLEIKPA